MEKTSHTKTISTLYIFLILSTILGFVPEFNAFLASLALWLIVLIAAYFYRAKDSEDGLLYNHMTYLVGTIWIGTSFIVLGTLIAGIWVYSEGDNTAVNAATESIVNGMVPDEAMMNSIKDQYIADNKNLLVTASTVAIGPAILYFVYRVANGLGRAAKGYRIANPKSWL